MPYFYDSTSPTAAKPARRPSLTRLTARLLLASALGGAAALAAPQAAQAQFVCVGNATGATVGAVLGPTASGDGADASGAPTNNNVACGTSANASGDNARNTASGFEANASGAGGRNTATGARSNASGAGGRNTATGIRSNASGVDSFNTALGVRSDASGQASANTATGLEAHASGDDSANIATGRFANASGNASGNVAIGNEATATGDGASRTAVGTFSSATHANSAAFGRAATTTRANQQVFGTTENTYTMPGITSAASSAAQGPVHGLVTTDANGNLASDGGEVFRRLDKNEEGVAVGIALSDPDLYAGKTFALKGNWGVFEGSNALGVSAKGLLADNLFGQGDQLTLSGGIGWGTDENTVGGRVSGQVSW